MAETEDGWDPSLRVSTEMQAYFTKHCGFGDLDPVTGPRDNPNHPWEYWQALCFMQALDAWQNPYDKQT